MVLRMTVARTGIGGGLEYLTANSKNTSWTIDQGRAEYFAGLHEATRVAMRLPAKFRAFAFPVAADAGASPVSAAR